MLYLVLINYGIPALFYTDRRTVFEYKRKDKSSDAEDTFTQFSYACHNLGIEIKTMSVPQAKGRVERLNQTLQSRLPVELRHAHITNIEDASVFLNSYIKKYNNQFALRLNSTNRYMRSNHLWRKSIVLLQYFQLEPLIVATALDSRVNSIFL